MTIIFDSETDSLDMFAKDIVLMCYADDVDTTIHTCTDVYALESRFESGELKVGHNLKFEKHKLLNYGINLRPPYFDTQIAAWLLGQGRPHFGEDGVKYSYGLKDLAVHHLEVVEPDSFKTLAKRYGKKVGRKLVEARASDIPTEVLNPYCMHDVSYTRQIWAILEKQIQAQGLQKRFEKIEMPFIDVLVDMERNGITLDVTYLLAYQEELTAKRLSIEEQLNGHLQLVK